MHDHWFDTLNKALVQEHPRRTLLGAVTVLAANRGVPRSTAAKKRKKGKGNGKGKGRGKNKNKRKGKGKAQSCGPDIHAWCDSVFSQAHHTQADRDFCKVKCERCTTAGTPFCIVTGGGAERATCCFYADECCGGVVGECCTADRCCDTPHGQTCAPPGEYCCRNGDGGSCPIGQECCGGDCVACEAPEILNPATCECEEPCGGSCVGPGLACCPRTGSDYACVDIFERIGNFHCGGCDQPCTGPYERCCDGTCFDIRFNNARCGGDCEPCPAGLECCHGQCIDPQTITCCPDHPSTYADSPWCSANQVCCTLPNGRPGCC